MSAYYGNISAYFSVKMNILRPP